MLATEVLHTTLVSMQLLVIGLLPILIILELVVEVEVAEGERSVNSLLVLVMVVLAVIAQDRRTSVRERNLRDASHRHWWNRTHGGH